MNADEAAKAPVSSAPVRRCIEVLAVFFRLGLTSFGGPVAHLGYFRDEFVVRRRWVDDRTYADLVALCQFLAGPASSQVGIAIGLSRAGYPGALAAWTGFTVPSAIRLGHFQRVDPDFAESVGVFEHCSEREVREPVTRGEFVAQLRLAGSRPAEECDHCQQFPPLAASRAGYIAELALFRRQPSSPRQLG